MPSLVLKRGAKIELGHRRGTVECVRGGRARPYEVRVRWSGETYPEYIVFSTLERDFRQGRLKLVGDP